MKIFELYVIIIAIVILNYTVIIGVILWATLINNKKIKKLDEYKEFLEAEKKRYSSEKGEGLLLGLKRDVKSIKRSISNENWR